MKSLIDMLQIKTDPFVGLLIIWLLAIAIRIILFTGYMNGDMGNYIQEAHNLSVGHYSIEEVAKGKSIEELIPGPNLNWQNLRLGLIIPVGVLMRLFGVSDVSYAIFMFACFTLSYCMVYLLGRDLIAPSFGVVSAVIFSFIPLEINLSTMLVPHIPAASFMALSCVLLLKGSRHRGWKSALFVFLSGATLSIAYHIWEISILLLPAIPIYLAITGGFRRFFLKKTFWALCLSFTLGFMPLFIAGIVYFYSISGIFFFQQKLISVMGPKWLELHPIDLGNLKWDIYPKSMFHSYYFGLFYYFVLGGLLTVSLQYVFNKKARGQIMSAMLLPIIWFLWLLTYLQFGTSSLSHYQPIFKMSHYLAVISIPGSLLAAYFIFFFPYDAVLKKIRLKPISIVYARTALITLFLISATLCSVNNFIGNGAFHRDMTFERRIKDALGDIEPNAPIYTDSWTKNGLDFVFKYERPIFAFNSDNNSDHYTPPNLSEVRSGYVVINWIFLSSGHAMKMDLPGLIYNPPYSWKLRSRAIWRAKSIDIYSVSG